MAADTRALVGRGFSRAASTDWAQLQAFRREFTDPIPANTEASLGEAGIDTYRGHARFVDRRTIEITPAAGSPTEARRLTARSFLIATGSRSRPLEVPGAELAGTSDDFLELDSLPESMVFIGGGYISLEFAYIAALAGVKVTILQRGERVLPQFPASIVEAATADAASVGIAIVTNVDVTGIEEDGSSLRVTTDSGVEFTGGFVMAAVGRTPNVDDLGLDAIGVDYSSRGIKADRFMATNVDGIYAAGDCVDGKQLSPISDMEAHVAAANMITAGSRSADYDAIPSVVFTHPQMAGVGLSVEEAQASQRAVTVRSGRGDSWPNYRRLNASPVAYEVVIDAMTDRILGAYLVGPYAGEQINVFALAIASGTTATELKRLPWAYPTYTSDAKYMV
ncbi:MAG: NAD(P)/FAD-dependent oxidoreductase [Spirochaetaceae bacterium]|nr:MAG: NAD(P)/FAD-dependent oxidoreductase [Spirochaetaceae bacterium]